MIRLRRTAARVVLVDHAYRVLLEHVHDPARPAAGTWWQPPLLRDLVADAALGPAVRLGPCVWTRGRERVHVAWLDDPRAPRSALAADPAARLGEWWWSLDELADTGERFRPARLPALVPAVVRGEYGPLPVALVD